MAMKAIKSITRTATINGEELTFTATQYKGKRHFRDGWRECVSTSGRCSKFNECEWFPENTDGFNLVKLDCDEYEFRDLDSYSGHLLWLDENGSFGMANQIYMYNDDTHFWWVILAL